jgi:hypothetical protein
MSSWIIARNVPSMKKVNSVINYHDSSKSSDVISLYMDYLSAYIYSQKMGEKCNVWDPTDIIKNTLRSQPQVKFLKELTEESHANSLDMYKSVISKIKYSFYKIFKIIFTNFHLFF